MNVKKTTTKTAAAAAAAAVRKEGRKGWFKHYVTPMEGEEREVMKCYERDQRGREV